MVVKDHHRMIIMMDCAVGGVVLYYTNDSTATCPCCSGIMNIPATFVHLPPNKVSTSLPTTKEGYVKGVVMYTIMDDLTVTPMSTISIIAMLHKFNLGQVESLEEKVGLELLKSIARVENCAY
ncbi:hypothetical protein PVK06_036499 [Gossypium arboreum]|uniref:Uncharacterized protein n=1 Tax=Gossypium arboreum TaxID=29729 RepID=A0ABR0NM56_GOSAR|nr:hypothetical protein PVK06_036499 [Gossypium arboreum]